MTRLNQILAVEKGIKAKAHEQFTTAYQAAQKPQLLNGFSKRFSPVTEGGEVFPPEAQRVQFTAADLTSVTERVLSDLFDVTLSKDLANCSAKADIILSSGMVLAKGIPATNLLFLEKQLMDLKTFFAAIPVLDSSEEWVMDAEAGLFKSAKTSTTRTAKIQEALVLYPATDKHPAQTQIITKDITVGHWETVKHSGALTKAERQGLLDRVEDVLRAVQKAREAANTVEVAEANIGRDVFNFLLRGRTA